MKFKILAFLFIVLNLSCQSERPKGWEPIYKNDKAGKTIKGSKANLILAIRSGADIKIGWGSQGKNHSIEHLSNPIWLAVLDGKEVIVHLNPQVLSLIDWENLSASYANTGQLEEEWRVVITTKGEFDAIWYDRKGDSLIKRIPQNHVITWFSRDNTRNVQPFFEQ